MTYSSKKIIVSLTDKTLLGMMKSALDLRSVYPQVYLEARLDGVNEINKSSQNINGKLKSLLMMFPDTHMVVTNYPKSEVGDKERFGYSGDEQSRWDILQYCANQFSNLNNVNYITAEVEGFRKINRDPSRAIVIAAKHFFTPYDTRQVELALKNLQSLVKNNDAEIAKVAALTGNTEEVADFRRLTQEYSKHMPLIAVPMGDYDFVKQARIQSFNEDKIFGTFAKHPKGKGAAPGQPTIEELIKS